MRKMIYVALLMGTTALYPSEARAMPPVLGFLGGVILGTTGITTGLIGLGTIGAVNLGFTIGSSILGGFLINTAISLGISALAAALRPRPPVPNPGAKLVNLRQSITYFEHVYGRMRKGGPIAFWQSKKGVRYYDIILAARQIAGIYRWYADERIFTIDGNGNAIEDGFKSQGTSRLRVVPYLGGPGQTAPALLETNFPEWTSAHNMDGLAHVVALATNVRAEDFSFIFPTGREPAITPVIDGYLCYDPRDGQTRWTTNAALILADWITSPDGLDRDVDWQQVAIEADVADQIILDRNGNPVPKWQLCGSYSSAEEREAVRSAMCVACDAFIYEDADGVVAFNLGRYMTPVVTVVDDDILSVQYSEGQPGTDVANAFTVEYTEADIGYRENASAPYVVIDPAAAYEEDALSLYWIPNHNQAVRVAKRLLMSSRAKYRASIVMKYHGVRLIGQRFFRLQHAEFGLDMVFEVDRLSRGEDGVTWTVECHSVEASDFAFNSAIEEPERPLRTDISDDTDIPEPVNVAATSQPYAGSVSIYVTWDAPEQDSLFHQVRFRTTSPVGEWTTLNAPAGQDHQYITGLLDNRQYDIQVRAVASTGRGSDWTPEPPITVTAQVDPVAPSPVTGVSATGGSGVVDLAWTAPNSSNYFGARVFRNTSNDIGTASLVATEYGAPNMADGYQDVGLSAGIYYYWIVAINGSGVGASPVATGSVTVT